MLILFCYCIQSRLIYILKFICSQKNLINILLLSYLTLFSETLLTSVSIQPKNLRAIKSYLPWTISDVLRYSELPSFGLQKIHLCWYYIHSYLLNSLDFISFIKLNHFELKLASKLNIHWKPDSFLILHPLSIMILANIYPYISISQCPLFNINNNNNSTIIYE